MRDGQTVSDVRREGRGRLAWSCLVNTAVCRPIIRWDGQMVRLPILVVRSRCPEALGLGSLGTVPLVPAGGLSFFKNKQPATSVQMNATIVEGSCCRLASVPPRV